MRLRTQFIVTMLLFGIILAVLAASAVITDQMLERVGQQEKIADKIAQGASDLSYLSNDYLIYRESQQLKRWQSRFASFSAEVAGLRAERPEQQALVANIQANQNRLKEVFDSTASALGSSPRNQGAALDPAHLQVSWSRMAVQSQGVVADASRLSHLFRQQMDQLTNARTTLMYVMAALFGLFLLASYMLTYRRILKSLAKLQAGAAVIGSGNLDFIIQERKVDEIGELSRAFNRMTTNLKAITASKADLEREIVERKRAEEDLRRQREWLRVTLSSIGDGVVTTDASGRVTFLNPVAQALTGWQPEEAVGQPVQSVFRIINEQSREPGEDIVKRVLREGSIVTLANRTALITRKGQEIPVEDSAAPIKDSEGNISGVVLVFHDVSEKRRSQDVVRESEKRYRNLFETMEEGFALHEIICDDGGRPCDYRFLQVNPAFERLTGLKAADIVGRTLYEVMPQSESLWVERYGSVALTGQPAHFDQWNQALGRHYEVRAFQIAKGRFGVVFHDVTERKRAEEALKKAHDELEVRVLERTAELARANTELQEEMAKREKAEQQLRQAQKLEAIGTLTGGIAHDLNNILAPIVINSEMALLDLPGESDVRSNLDLILQSGLRGKDLVKQMLLFSRKSEKKQEILSLTPLIKETFKLLRSSIPTTIQMKLSLETETDAVYADPSQIQQVIMNLCTNATYAMRGMTGSIDLSLQAITFGPDDLPEADMQPGNFLVLAVKDTGSGMDEEVRKRIFEPFFTTKPVGEGTGLGLPVVYGIVKNHKGNITVYSEPGRGSIFRVYLPKADTGVSVEAEAPKPIPKGNERILLVDDEQFIVNSVGNMLQRLGYKVTALINSEEALKLFSADPSQFDLVITDQTMPSMTGEDLGKELMRIRPDIPVILCTGYSDLISSEKAMGMGFRGYIMKPFTTREGAELLRQVLDQKEPASLTKGP